MYDKGHMLRKVATYLSFPVLRKVATYLSFLAVLGSGIGFNYVFNTIKQDQLILEWTNVLVWKVLQWPYTPRVFPEAIRADARPNVWRVIGEIAMPGGDGERTQERYVAVIRKVCDASMEECWHLEKLTIGDEVWISEQVEDLGTKEVVPATTASPFQKTLPESAGNTSTQTEAPNGKAKVQTKLVVETSQPKIDPSDYREPPKSEIDYVSETTVGSTQAFPPKEKVKENSLNTPPVPAKKPRVSADTKEEADRRSFAIQLASVRTKDGTEIEWKRLQRQFPDLLARRDLVIQTVDLEAQGTFFRIMTGSFESHTDAYDLCAEFKSREQNCLVARLTDAL